MITTKLWAEALGVPNEQDLEPVPDFTKALARTAAQVAARALALQGVIAIAYGVDAEPIVAWFQKEGLWKDVTPREREFIYKAAPTEQERVRFQWKQEAQWTLLWMIQWVESLGLPTQGCDTRRIADDIMPALGDSIEGFLQKSELRSPGALLAEDERTYNLWCYALAAQRRKEELPNDLNMGVLFERRYAFEWMDGHQDWDEVTCDA